MAPSLSVAVGVAVLALAYAEPSLRGADARDAEASDMGILVAEGDDDRTDVDGIGLVLPEVDGDISNVWVDEEILKHMMAPASAHTDSVGNEQSNSSEPEVAERSDISQELVAAGYGSCHGSDKVVDASKTCAASENYHCGGCYIYRRCQHYSACHLNGYMIAPGKPLRGMEDIDGSNARSWDYLWSAARSRCGSNSCVLISNPIHFRTQHQMHLHYRHYNGGGAALKKRLESTVCGTSGWQPFNECGNAKAALFDHMPGVFSTVDQAYGGGNMANVGITVWFTSACGGGQKTMILAQTGCSIEHSISAR